MTTTMTTSALQSILDHGGTDLLTEWMESQRAANTTRGDLVKENDLRDQCRRFLTVLGAALRKNSLDRVDGPDWADVREFLSGVSKTRTDQGFSPAETAMFVFSLKQPLFRRLREDLESQPAALADETWTTTLLLDRLGLYTTEVHQQRREAIIKRQQDELIELSTPVVELWEDVVALPLIGTLDSSRTQIVMENLLTKITENGASIAIIDITGVPTVDTLVAQHLLKTVAAARLMGADCIISGIRPSIAQTIVHLGVNLSDVVTKATRADALALALDRGGHLVTRRTRQ